jgi:hypothetical protein
MPDDAIRQPDDAVQPPDPSPQPLRPAWADDGGPPAPESWTTFRTGARCVRVAILVWVVTFVGEVVFLGLALGLDSPTPLFLASIYRVVFSLIGVVVGLVGLALLCVVPRATRLRPLAGVGLAAAVAAMLLPGVAVGSAFLAELRGPESGGLVQSLGWVVVPAGLAALLALICHFLLLAGAARRLGDPGLATNFLAFAFVFLLVPLGLVGCVGVEMAGTVLSGASGGRSRGGSEGFLCLVLPLFAALLLRLLVLLTRLIERWQPPVTEPGDEEDEREEIESLPLE